MTRETKVGVAAIAAIVGVIGWSVAEGVSNRPAPVETAAVTARQEAVPVAPETGPPATAAHGSCCKDKSHADHSNCPMKKPEPAPDKAGAAEAPKCPYMASRAKKD